MIETYLTYRKRRNASAATLAAERTRLLKFLNFLDLWTISIDEISTEYIKLFAETLEAYSTSYAHNVLSAVNNFLKFLRKPELVLSPSEITKRRRIRCRVTPIYFDYNDICAAADEASRLDPRFGLIIRLAALVGLRLREAILLEFKESLKSLQQFQQIDIIHGTKGGRSRTVERLVTPLCIKDTEDLLKESLPYGNAFRGNMLYKDETLKQFYSRCERNILPILKRHNIPRIHDLRVYFAITTYEQMTGFPAAVLCDTLHPNFDKALDEKARNVLSHQLGHSRRDITNSYLGKNKRKKS